MSQIGFLLSYLAGRQTGRQTDRRTKERKIDSLFKECTSLPDVCDIIGSLFNIFDMVSTSILLHFLIATLEYTKPCTDKWMKPAFSPQTTYCI